MLPRDHATSFKIRDGGLASSPALPSPLLQISYPPLNNATFICQKKIKCNFLKRAQASLFLLLPQSIFFNANKKPFNKPSILLCLSMWITPEFSISTTVFMCLRINSSSTTWVKQTYLQHCTTFLTKLIIILLQLNSLEVSGLTDYFVVVVVFSILWNIDKDTHSQITNWFNICPLYPLSGYKQLTEIFLLM